MSRRRHGLADQQIYALAKAQGFRCALSGIELIDDNGIIRDPTTRQRKRVSIDHDHKTGWIRGLLVEKVNWLVDQWEHGSYGVLKEPPEIEQYRMNPPAFEVLGRVRYEE